ncbi:hypothetical protein MNEG_6796 [Monoraphidium neglectum]|jgi:hypothetical protein|uniref:Uncharacterized protein n=1 Tax=Monoraphidium neglectum TaxID=145388 RepID=A0A0D2N5F3_9CHLO|nr:hypothetical protein MNEG_6796 [Monoraphidium neglectum]KIZ01166.1 hypothetical protein MNEG_6796 [Monoraphidium neglectum]|eukprot:XP_013900185.1 hypothetical protein MNEG_6796 [Monoraphidium neglectum]
MQQGRNSSGGLPSGPPSAVATAAATAAAAAAAALSGSCWGSSGNGGVVGGGNTSGAGAPNAGASGGVPSDSAASGVEMRAISKLSTFMSIPHLMGRRFNGKSVLQLKSAGDISWRKGQKLWKPLWRKLNLVVRRVAE